MNKMRALKYSVFLFLVQSVLFVISGCGYTSRSLIADKYQTIYVENFINKIDITREGDVENKYKIYKPTLEVDITHAVINRFILDGNLKPVKSGSADLTLKGTLVEFSRDPLRYTNNDEVKEYRINVRVDFSIKDNKEDKMLWQETRFTGDTTYFTQGNSAKSDDVAVSDAVDDLARRIVERIVEQW